LLEQCEWDWLFGFENRKRIFAIDNRYRFAAIVGTKGGTTKSVAVAVRAVRRRRLGPRKHPRTRATKAPSCRH
jgi:hypothetical protein